MGDPRAAGRARARSSAGCSPSRARRTRASSATRSPTRTCSASRPAPGLGATIAIAYLPDGLRGQRALPVAAFVGGAIAVILTYAVGRSARRERDAATLVLAGVTVAAFFTAWQTFVQQQNSETLQQVYTWILGNIPSTGWTDVVLILPYVAVAAVVIIALRRVVDVLNLGDDEAASLGVNVRRVRLALVVAATLGTAAAVAVSGLIGFVGIIVPHAIRLLSGGELPGAAAALGDLRRGVPRSRGRDRAHGALAGGDPARRRDCVLRRALLRARAALDAEARRDRDRPRRRHRRARRAAGRRGDRSRRRRRASGSRSSARTARGRRRCCGRSRGWCPSRARSRSTAATPPSLAGPSSRGCSPSSRRSRRHRRG